MQQEYRAPQPRNILQDLGKNPESHPTLAHTPDNKRTQPLNHSPEYKRYDRILLMERHVPVVTHFDLKEVSRKLF